MKKGKGLEAIEVRKGEKSFIFFITGLKIIKIKANVTNVALKSEGFNIIVSIYQGTKYNK